MAPVPWETGAATMGQGHERTQWEVFGGPAGPFDRGKPAGPYLDGLMKEQARCRERSSTH